MDNDSYLGCDLPSLNEHEEAYECNSQSLELNNEVTEPSVTHLGGGGSVEDGCFGSNLEDTENLPNDEYESSSVRHNSYPADQSSANGIPSDTEVKDRLNGDTGTICMDIVDADCISMDNLDKKNMTESKRGNGVSMDRRGVQGVYGTKGHTDGSSAEKLDTIDDSKRDIDCLFMHNFDVGKTEKYDGCGISRGNLDMKDHSGVYGVNKGICDSHVDNTRLCIAEDSKIRKNENRPLQMNEMFMSGQTVDSSRLCLTVNSYPTPTQDNFNESSDEDLEEIVYKGEMT